MKKQLSTLIIAAGLAALCVAALAPNTLTMDGVTISNRVKVIGGESWIPVSDLAKAKGMQIANTTTSIDLTTAGGSNQVGGTIGKVGDTIFTGKWRIQVQSFLKVKKYTIKNKTSTDYSVYDGVADLEDQVFKAKPGFDLYVAKCTLKNARTGAEQFDWNPIDNQSSIADADGSNHPWLVYDIPSPAFVSSAILPGSKIDFNICFAVAKKAKPTEIVLMLKSLSDSKSEVARIEVSDSSFVKTISGGGFLN
jgi:hypothetical protein